MLLLSAVWAIAQYDSQPSASDQSSMGMGKTTVRGCLSESNGNYSLTDDSGTAYQITGDTSKLQAHVGHTIQVMGTTGSSADSSGTMSKHAGSMSGPNDTQHTLAMTSFKHVTAGCNSGH
jgi:hypothetical protein